MKVVSLNKNICDFWIKNKHYSKRPSIFWKGFGIIIDDKIEGVCVYGQPSPSIQKYAFSDRNFKLYELSRLVIQTKRKNAASFLISNSLKKLESCCAVVSYADSAYGHCGYVYQATNWLYTGETKSHDCLYLVNNEKLHPMTIRDRFDVTEIKKWAKNNNIEMIRPKLKYRYFYLKGNKAQRKFMYKNLSYDIVKNYPKLTPRRYDDGEHISMDYKTCNRNNLEDLV